MKLNVYDTPAAASQAAAEVAAGILREAIAAQGRAVFVAATGNSQLEFLKHLTAAPGIAWERTAMFHLDEYIGIPSSHPASFRRYLGERLTSRVPVGRVHFIQGDSPDLSAELARLNAVIAATTIDVAFIDIGKNGHIAFNDPPADFANDRPFIVVNLDEACRRQQIGEGWYLNSDIRTVQRWERTRGLPIRRMPGGTKPRIYAIKSELDNWRRSGGLHVAREEAAGDPAPSPSVAVLPFLGTAFIPEMKEGSVVPGINRVPNISLDESIKMEMEAMRLVMQVPGVKSAVSGVGRGESPADSQEPNESTPIVSLKPRSEWPSGWTQDDIQDAMRDKLKALPGVQIVMAQPISDRVDEMVTGVRSDIAVKVFGDDLDQLKKIAGQIGKVAQGLQGAQDLRIERISGQQYLTVEIDRQAIARLGMNVSDVNDVLETAIGGKEVTEIFEGERRLHSAITAYPGAANRARNMSARGWRSAAARSTSPHWEFAVWLDPALGNKPNVDCRNRK